MKPSRRRLFTSILLCTLLLTSTRPASARVSIETEVVLIFVAVGAVGAALGVGVYYAVRRAPSITGCAVSGPDGLSLQNEADHQAFHLAGDTATLKAGDRIRVQGKKKDDAAGTRTFLVHKLTRDFGPCTVSPAAP
ncbi:MAG: hypothetical protein NVSMB3_00840 [Acidobacteriaceae bacterium]